ncbi:ABC transporter ATP-binding protein [Undibacterium sp. SXout7W]|uniref:ABC transporter ATP-binding protein n=1 Tax=Undibacterium sp. SXout7W TaxID=3413049 RepID=UPI003BF25298
MGSILVNHVGKAYKQYPKRWSRMAEWVLPFLGLQHQLKWVLKDINFQIAAGEAVGIIGINGAGKSTLLKLITGTTQPSTGDIVTHGRVAALLELGMGFHPDASGRDNVLMAGQLMGLSRDDVYALMPQIEAFAEIGEYIDSPVRVYSSGMQMRLAFSVATCVRPDILIVDEALAVGDVFFQQKCFERITQFTKEGTTLLFVSHSTGTVLNTCTRCLFIKEGSLAFDGSAKEAIDLYQAELLSKLDKAKIPLQIHQNNTEPSDSDALLQDQQEIVLFESPALEGKTGSISTDKADCIGVRFIEQNGRTMYSMIADSEVTLRLDFRIKEKLDDPHAGFKIRNRFGVVLFETNTYCMQKSLGSAEKNSILSVQFSFNLSIFPDEYTITIGLANGGYGEGSFKEVIVHLHEVTAFVVLPNPAAITWAGLTNLQPNLHFEKIESFT